MLCTLSYAPPRSSPGTRTHVADITGVFVLFYSDSSLLHSTDWKMYVDIHAENSRRARTAVALYHRISAIFSEKNITSNITILSM